MKKVVFATLLGIISASVIADAPSMDFSAEAKKVMSFEDPYIADTTRMIAEHEASMREHYIKVAKDMMSFEDEYIAETAKMAANQKVAAKSKGKKSAEPKQEELHIDP